MSTPIDAYFALGNHVAAGIWAKFDEAYRDSALATATRQIAVFLGRESLTDAAIGIIGDTRYKLVIVERDGRPTVQIVPTESTDMVLSNNILYAVFEQALHVAKASGAALDRDKNRPMFIPPDQGERSNSGGWGPNLSPNDICPAALAYLRGFGGGGKPARRRIEIVRG
ncbi:MAG: hypothetical protein WAN85_04800 [Bacteroidales bacterium]|jgi:hypothetical protein